MHKIMMIVVSLTVLGCQHTPKQKAVKETPDTILEQRDAAPLSLVKEGFRRHNADQYAKSSRELMSVLQNAKVASTGKEFFLYDVSCYVVSNTSDESPQSSCSYYLKSRDQKKRVKKVFSGPEAEKLRLLLSEFPVNQGDSGVATKYLHCEQTNSEVISCDLAVELNYAGP